MASSLVGHPTKKSVVQKMHPLPTCKVVRLRFHLARKREQRCADRTGRNVLWSPGSERERGSRSDRVNALNLAVRKRFSAGGIPTSCSDRMQSQGTRFRPVLKSWQEILSAAAGRRWQLRTPLQTADSKRLPPAASPPAARIACKAKMGISCPPSLCTTLFDLSSGPQPLNDPGDWVHGSILLLLRDHRAAASPPAAWIAPNRGRAGRGHSTQEPHLQNSSSGAAALQAAKQAPPAPRLPDSIWSFPSSWSLPAASPAPPTTSGLKLQESPLRAVTPNVSRICFGRGLRPQQHSRVVVHGPCCFPSWGRRLLLQSGV